MTAPWEKYAPDKNDPAPWKKYDAERAALDKEVSTEGELRLAGMDSGVRISGKPWQFLVSTGQGIMDLWGGVNQIVRSGEDEKAYTARQQEDLDQFAKIQAEAPITTTIGRVTGQVAPSLVVPGGAAARGINATVKAVPKLARFAKAGAVTDAAAVSGLQGAMNFVPEGESRLENTWQSAATGAGATKGLQLAARGVVPKSALPQLAGTRAGYTEDEIAVSLKTEGIDWNKLSTNVREALVKEANSAAKAGAPVTPVELARFVRAQKLPGGGTTLTKGQMTGDRNQLRTEFNLRRTSAGATLDQQLVEQDEALANALDVIKLKTGGTTVADRGAEAGQKITKPLIDQLSRAQSKVDELYKVADEAGETAQQVDPTPLIRWVEDNFAAQHSAPALKSLVAQLKKSGLVTVSDDGIASAGRQPTVRELEELRKAMNKWGRADDASGHWMGEAKRVIDGITDGKGGDLYAQARAARIALRNQFEDPGIINRLISEKPGGDRVTAFEDVFRKSVIDSSAEDLVKLRGQLLAKSDIAKPADGVQAFKDLRGATLDYIKMGALNNASGDFSYAGLKKAIQAIGPEKLEVLFGKNTANEITSVLDSAKDMKAVFNKAGIYNPGTASAVVDWLDRLTGLVGLPQAASYTTAVAKRTLQGLSNTKAAGEATEPLQAAYRAGAKAKDDQYKALMNLYAGRAGAAGAPGVAAAVSAPKPAEDAR